MTYGPSEKWAPRETAYMAEWAKKEFPNDVVEMRARLGRAPESLENEMGPDAANRRFRPFMRWADGVVLRADQVVIIEAKLRGDPAAVAQLKYYADLFGKTFAYREHWPKPRRLVLLTPWEDPDLEDYAQRQGVEVIHWVPPWLDAYLEHRKNYNSKEWRARREAERALNTDGMKI